MVGQFEGLLGDAAGVWEGEVEDFVVVGFGHFHFIFCFVFDGA